MRAAPFVAALVGLGALWLAARSARAAQGEEGATASFTELAQSWLEETMDDLYRKWGAVYAVDWRLVKAIAQHESGENPAAVNTRDNESLGLMQVLCRPDGQGGCANKLNVDGWSEATRERLLEPDFNVQIGVQILAWNLKTFGFPKGIAVYNAWDQRDAPMAGPFKNQGYVDDVLRRARALG